MPPTNTGDLNYRWASQLIEGLCSAGAKHAVISPGARSTPLVLACDQHQDIEPHVIIDERCASFFALGLAKSTTSPVILIATSGSAPAHWLPAVIEASHSKIPLILLTADRPPELLGTGANQTTDQSQLFSGHVRLQHNPGVPRDENSALQALPALARRVVSQARWPNPGPVHLNQPFAEPLLPETALPQQSPTRHAEVMPLPTTTIAAPQLEQLLTLLPPGNGIIVCGPMVETNPHFNRALCRLAEKLAAPILADPLSGLRWGEPKHHTIICQYDVFLRQPQTTPEIDWILRFGAPPISKTLQQWLQQECSQIICDPFGEWPDPFHRLTQMVRSDPTELCLSLSNKIVTRGDKTLLKQFQLLESDSLARIINCDALPIEASIVQTLFDQLPEKTLLLAGNSMPIRQVDSWSKSGSREISIVGNRGISGIDGHLSTLAGLAEGSGQLCVALVGDLTFYHDMNGLACLQHRDAVIVLLNNSGGGIFGYLPQSKLDSYKQYWSTPIEVSFQHAAATYGIEYQKCHTAEAFAERLAAAISRSGPQLIEVTIDRDLSIQQHQAFWQQTD